MRPFLCKKIVLKSFAHLYAFLIKPKITPSKRLNHKTVQNPGAGIKLKTECNVPIKIINNQLSKNNNMVVRSMANTTKNAFVIVASS